MSDGVLIEREGRLEFFTQPASLGYVILDRRRVLFQRRAFVATPILVLLGSSFGLLRILQSWWQRRSLCAT